MSDPGLMSDAALQADLDRYLTWYDQPQVEYAATEEAVHDDIEADGDQAQLVTEAIVDEFAELRSLVVEAHKSDDEAEIGRKFTAMARRYIKARVQALYDQGEMP